MSDQSPISTEHQVARHCLAELMRAHEFAPHVPVAVADAFLAATAPQWPDCAPLLGGAQAEADWWADFASDTMVAAMLSACLKRLTRQPMLAPNAKKRALVALWNSLNEQDRTAFLEFVDPSGAGT